MSNMVRVPRKLVLDRIHIEGKGLRRAIIKKAARELGLTEGVEEVVLHGGVRTSGANLGSTQSYISRKPNTRVSCRVCLSWERKLRSNRGTASEAKAPSSWS
jgi:hypothetical protein